MARRTKEEMVAERALVAKIHRALDMSTAAVERAMLLLYGQQTQDEQVTETTREHNDVGFSANDATVGTRIVKNVILRAQGAGVPEGKRLWGSALAIGRRIAKRYAATQLLHAAHAKQTVAIVDCDDEHDYEIELERAAACDEVPA